MDVLVVCLVAFVFGFVGSMPLAGPIAVLVISTAFRKDYGSAIALNIGASLAEGIYAFAAFWGFATFLASHEAVIPIAHAVTAVVLLALGVYFLFWKPRGKAQKDEKRASFWVGLSVSALNPTLFVTWSTAVAWVYSHGFIELKPWLAVPWGIAAAAGVTAWFFVLVWLVRRLHGRLPGRVIVWIVRTMGLALIGLSVWSGIEFVKYITK
jgi:threonine/homoserine/homoserine lactone efflux protein